MSYANEMDWSQALTKNRKGLQVKRMLRLGEEEEAAVQAFHRVHPEARRSGWGRVFRSPTVFEDCIKAILLCNCG